MDKKQALRLSAFLLIVVLLIFGLCDVFEYQSSHMSERFRAFRELEPNTVDAVYIGSSAVDRYWIAGQAFEDYGMTVYPLSTNGQPVWLIKNMLVEAYRDQDPQLVIIDARSFTADITEDTGVTDARCRYVIDVLDFWSENRMDAIRRTKDVMCRIDPEISENDLSYFFTFVKYHNRWCKGGVSLEDITDPASPYLGFYMHSQKSARRVTIDPSEKTDERVPLDEFSEKYLYELIDYLKENEINAMFVNSPHTEGREFSARLNTVFDILTAEGFECVDFNTPEMLEKYPYDFSGDFLENNHANYWGAVKYTTYFSAYLDEHYDLPDHREDDRCKGWYGVADAIAEQIAEWDAQIN